MAISLFQSKSVQGASVTGISLAFDSNCNGGTTIIAAVTSDLEILPQSISDNSSGTGRYTMDGHAATEDNLAFVAIFRHDTTPEAAVTVTYSKGASGDHTIAIHEYFGLRQSAVLETSTQGRGSVGTHATVTTPTSRVATYLAFAADTHRGGTSTPTVNNSFTLQQSQTSSSDTPIATADRIYSSAAAAQVDFSWETAQYCNAMVLYRAGDEAAAPEPYLRRVGAVTNTITNNGNISLGAPAGIVDDDILVAVIVSKDNVNPTGTPAGWTWWYQQNHSGSSTLRTSIAWKRASGESGSYLFTRSGTTVTMGFIAAFGGCVATGDPLNVGSTPKSNSSSTTITADSITTTVDNALVLFVAAYGDDWANIETAAGTDPYFVYAQEEDTANGTDTAVALQWGQKPAQGSTGSKTAVAVGGAGAALNMGTLLALTPLVTAVTGSATLGGRGSVTVAGSPAQSGAAAIQGRGSIAAAGSQAQAGAAALGGRGALTAAGAITDVRGAAALSGRGSVTVAGSPAQSGAAAIQGRGSIAVTGSQAQAGAAALGGRGSIAVTGSQAQAGAAALGGRGAFSVSGSQAQAGTAALAGRGFLTAAGSITDVRGSAALGGRGALVGSGSPAQSGAATLGGRGSLAASGSQAQTGASPLDGRGTLLAAGNLSNVPGAAVLDGRGRLTATPEGDVAFQASLSGRGSLAAQGSAAQAVAVALQGRGALVAAASVSQAGAALLIGSGRLVAAATTSGDNITAGLQARGTLTCVASVDQAVAVGLRGVGSLAGAAATAQVGAAALRGAGTLVAGGATALQGAAALQGSGRLAVDVAVHVPGAAELRGRGALVAAPVVDVSIQALLGGLGLLIADAATSESAVEAMLQGRGSLTAAASVLLRYRPLVYSLDQAEFDQEPPGAPWVMGSAGSAEYEQPVAAIAMNSRSAVTVPFKE